MNLTTLRTGSRLLAGIQGLYYLITGIWPLVHMESFLAVTGPKTDLWLVQTVGALIAVIGAMLLASASGRVTWGALLSARSATALDLSMRPLCRARRSPHLPDRRRARAGIRTLVARGNSSR